MLGLIWLKAVSFHLLLSLSVTAWNSTVQEHDRPRCNRLPPLRDQAALQDVWTKERISNIPNLLQKYRVGAWLMSQKEYAEDTVFWSLKSATQFSARRRTIQLYLANATDGQFAYTWIDNTPGVWGEVLDVLEAQNPSSIAINTHSEIAFSGGLHAGELDNILKHFGPDWGSRLVTKPMLAVEFIATKLKDQLPWYRLLQETAWAMISEAFSEKVIVPGTTTTKDVEWWLREKIQQMNYTTWFMPDVEIVDANIKNPGSSYSFLPETIINYGDLLHVDFGLTTLGLNTDTQHLGYVLYPGETEADIPQGLRDGLKKANRLQDIVKENMKVGTSGNEILKVCLDQMRSEGFEGMVYSHPIGDWGHSAGTLIGMTNLQEGVPILGDLPLLDNTYYSIELYAEHHVVDRNRNGSVPFYLEEDIYFVDGETGWDWVWERQENFHLIRTAVEDVMRVQYLG